MFNQTVHEMKKLLLFSLILCFAMVTFSQKVTIKQDKFKRAKYDNELINRATDNATNFNQPVNMLRSTGAVAPTEAQIGITYYDLFSNFNVGNRLWVFDDYTIAGVWMYGIESTVFPDRGTGYNYYNGTEWGPEPTVRIEDLKCGWPSITAWGTGGEISVAHNGVTGLEIIQRETKGEGEWTQTNFLGPPGNENGITWPRMVCSGENNEYSHIVVNSNGEWQGQSRTITYSRSDDGGATWNPNNIVLELLGPDYYTEITQDKYVMASNGNVVCILYVNNTTDLFYLRSDDNGDNWEKQIVWEHPIPFYEPSATQMDSIWVPDLAGHMCIDNDGMAHVVFGITRYINDDDGEDFFSNHPDWNDGIAYWNDSMEPFNGSNPDALAPPDIPYANSDLVEDETYIGWMIDLDGDGVVTLEGNYETRVYGMSTYPAVHVDDFGRRFIVYAANAETYVFTGGTDPVNYKHIFGRAYDGGGGWGDIMHLTTDPSHLFHDCVYSMIGNNSDNNIYYMYQADITPGNALDGNHDYQENKWIVGSIPKTDLMTGINQNIIEEESPVSQNFPNPFNRTSSISVNIKKAAELSLVVTSLTGQKVLEYDMGQVAAQKHTFTINAADLEAGIYFYTVTIGNKQYTRKIIVE